ncbi:MAG: hydantoin racemase [Prevotella sp.]|nr:MAG: hydantoin racemase [Prevotella sp.]
MVFGGRKDELLAVRGCGMNRLDNAKQVSNVTRIRDK